MLAKKPASGSRRKKKRPSSPIPPKKVPVYLLAFSVGAIVANIYYVQPLLAAMARTFSVSVGMIGLVAMLTQVGTALGMLVFVPLGDSRDRRALLTALLSGATVALCGVATAQNLIWISIASFAVGACGAAVHVIVPFAAQLAPENSRGQVLGTVFSGLLIGILLARTFSGVVASYFGWRSVYAIAAAGMLGLLLLLRARLPKVAPQNSLPWPVLMRSLVSLVRDHPALRESAFLGAALLCVFSAFWTTLVFLLQTPPYHYGSSVAGLFGLVGAAGALCAPLVGRFADRRGPRFTILLALVTTLASFLLLGVFGKVMAGLIAGVVLLDVGVQSGHVANQTRIYALDATARSRLNTVYMFCYFSGGSLGSWLGAICWEYKGWTAVCALGVGVVVIALAVFARNFKSLGTLLGDRLPYGRGS
jgi:predicted MFS family arabinose efflux permease